jgi:hypothetical protein
MGVGNFWGDGILLLVMVSSNAQAKNGVRTGLLGFCVMVLFLMVYVFSISVITQSVAIRTIYGWVLGLKIISTVLLRDGSLLVTKTDDTHIQRLLLVEVDMATGSDALTVPRARSGIISASRRSGSTGRQMTARKYLAKKCEMLPRMIKTSRLQHRRVHLLRLALSPVHRALFLLSGF